MIRIRNKDGSVVECPDGGFVELCDAEGNPGFVFWKSGSVFKVVSGKDEDAARYAKLFDIRFSENKTVGL